VITIRFKAGDGKIIKFLTGQQDVQIISTLIFKIKKIFVSDNISILKGEINGATLISIPFWEIIYIAVIIQVSDTSMAGNRAAYFSFIPIDARF